MKCGYCQSALALPAITVRVSVRANLNGGRAELDVCTRCYREHFAGRK